MSLKDYINEKINAPSGCKTLSEASMSRMVTHINDGRPIAAISAYRGILPPEQNKFRGAALANYVQAAGYGFFWVDGQYWEEYKGDRESWEVFKKEHPHLKKTRIKGGVFEYHVFERSIFVIGNLDDKLKLFDLMKKLCNKFDQDSFLYKPENQVTAAFIRKDGSKDFDVGTFRPMKMTDFSSIMHNRKPFVFESVTAYEPMNYIERYREAKREKGA